MRWYEPRIGSYVTPDTLLLEAGFNHRAYAPNPYRFIDPMGEFPIVNGQPLDLSKPGPHATAGNPGGPPGFVDCPMNALNAAGDKLRNSKLADGTKVHKAIDAAGAEYGCHSCGTKNPLGPAPDYPQDAASVKKAQKKHHFVPDHQPPAVMHTPRKGKAIIPKKDIKPGAVRLYPHCRKCSSKQGGQMSGVKQNSTNAQLKATAQAQMNSNLGI
jgi:hypothetical protein